MICTEVLRATFPDEMLLFSPCHWVGNSIESWESDPSLTNAFSVAQLLRRVTERELGQVPLQVLVANAVVRETPLSGLRCSNDATVRSDDLPRQNRVVHLFYGAPQNCRRCRPSFTVGT